MILFGWYHRCSKFTGPHSCQFLILWKVGVGFLEVYSTCVICWTATTDVVILYSCILFKFCWIFKYNITEKGCANAAVLNDMWNIPEILDDTACTLRTLRKWSSSVDNLFFRNSSCAFWMSTISSSVLISSAIKWSTGHTTVCRNVLFIKTFYLFIHINTFCSKCTAREFYQELYSSEQQEIPKEPMALYQFHGLVKMQSCEVNYAIKRNEKRKAPGPDNVVSDLLRDARKVMCTKLVEVFNKCLLQCKVPEEWNSTVITLLCTGKAIPRPSTIACL